MYHIKDNNKTLCGKSIKNIQCISFSSAGRATLSGCCPVCKQKYIEILEKFARITEQNLES